MYRLIRWFILNPVAANLIMLLIMVAGVLSLSTMRVEGFPKLPADTLQIETTFLDAYAEQVDLQITQKIEKALEGLAGIKKVQSTSLEGFSSIMVQRNEGYSLQRLQEDIRARLDTIYNLPKTADKPIITRNDFDFPALIVQLHGEVDRHTLQRLGRAMREELLAQPEISKLKAWGESLPEIRIEVYPEILEQYNLNIRDLVEKIQQSSLTFKAGSLKTEGSRIALRADNQAYHYRDFAEIPVFQQPDGTQVLLGDLSQIKDAYEDDDVIVRFNGVPALGMEVLIGRTENLLKIADVVEKTVEKFQKNLPSGIEISVWADSSHYISERLHLLKDNALIGLLLVFILLALFLNLKLAFWVAMGVPISIAGAMAVMGMSWVDYSLNDITTFGFIIALGILVDDAVVVGESVFEERKHSKDPVKGTLKGVHRVATATIFGTLTTVAAFFPLMLIDNMVGKIMASFSGVVILTLLFSLFESKFILPAHLAAISLEKSPSKKQRTLWITCFWNKLQKVVQNQLDRFIQKIYKPVLQWSLKQRYAIFILFIAVAALGIGLIEKGKISTVFFPDIPSQVITVKMEMDTRSPYRLTIQNANRIEDVANALNAQWVNRYELEDKPIKHILVVVSGAFMVEIYAELSSPSGRSHLATLDILQQWQEGVGRLEGTTELTFSATEETGGGFSIELYSKDEAQLKAASDALLTYLQGIKGVSNVRDSLKNGKPELSLKIKPQAHYLGFTSESLATQIGDYFGGAEAQRVQRDRQEVRVIVKNSEESRKTIANLMQIRLKSESGLWFPLTAVASIESAYVTDYLVRRDGKRVNTIYASIDKRLVAPSEISQDLFSHFVPDLEKRLPQVTIMEAGELKEMTLLKGNLIHALIFTCILIYSLLAIPLKSYWQPLIIMSVIPFGFVGAVMGHIIMGLPLSFLSFLGMLALTGVVVNDSLVLMTRYNQVKAAGNSVNDALMNSGMRRFKAIFLTTVTTVTGLMPLMSETSEQAQYLIPAAVSLAYGELFATLITLILVPVLIAISVDLQQLLLKISLGGKKDTRLPL